MTANDPEPPAQDDTKTHSIGAVALDVLTLLHETGALLQGHFRLSSGLHSPNYVQCALLLEHPRNAKRSIWPGRGTIDSIRCCSRA